MLDLDRIEAVRDGDWAAGITFPGMDAGRPVAGISEPGPNVPNDVLDAVIVRREELLEDDADATVWRGTPFENWSDTELMFDIDTLDIDTIDVSE